MASISGVLIGFLAGLMFFAFFLNEEDIEQIPPKPIIHEENVSIRHIFAEIQLPLEELHRHPGAEWVSEQLKWKLMNQAWYYTKVEQSDKMCDFMRCYTATLLVVEKGRQNPLIGERKDNDST